ncbi:MAG: UDP-3-O-(3-hydroxymyristoyl)glucosamine N-acyltransferase [Bacteroidia bacterium]
MLQLPISRIADMLQARVEGPSEIMIQRLAAIESAQEGDISFLANAKYAHHLYNTGASAVILAEDFELQQPIHASILRVPDPYQAFAKLQTHIAEILRPAKSGREEPQHIHSDAVIGEQVYLGAFCYIGENAVIGDGCQIYPYAYIGDGCVLGENTVVYPHVTIYPETIIGSRCIIHAGARLGGDGFGFAPQPDGSFQKIPQLGKVVLEDDVEIGANTTIDRATLGETVIRQGAKIDNLVMIAHNVEVGSGAAMAAQSGIAGSSKLGKRCLVGGQVGIAGHLNIEDGITLDAQTGINRSLANTSKMYRGSPAQPFRDQLRSEAIFRKLPELLKRLEALEKQAEDD